MSEARKSRPDEWRRRKRETQRRDSPPSFVDCSPRRLQRWRRLFAQDRATFAASYPTMTRLSCLDQLERPVHLVEMFTFLAGGKSWIGDLGRLWLVKVSFAATARTTWRPTCHRQYQVAARRRAHRCSSSRCVTSIPHAKSVRHATRALPHLATHSSCLGAV